jgi:ELWxxDGT repeat protein
MHSLADFQRWIEARAAAKRRKWSRTKRNFFEGLNGEVARPLFVEPLADRRMLSAQMLQNINTLFAGVDGDLTSAVTIGGFTYFAGREVDDQHGTELWRTDGTSAGTALVRDIAPGSYGSNPTSLTNVSGTLFFAANNGSNGVELWRSNGTSAGTMLVRDIGTGTRLNNLGIPGPNSSSPASLANVNGVLYFAANNGTSGSELWKSNGSSAGTVLVADIRPGANASAPAQLTNANGTLFFVADNGVNGRELWKSNGTSAGTALVRDIIPAALSSFSSPTQLTALGSLLFFVVDDGAHGDELWKTNGTSAGTLLVRDIFPAGPGSQAHALTNVNGTLFFAAHDDLHGEELWKTNGTSAGTVQVRDIQPGSSPSFPSYLTNVNGTLYFTASDATHGQELWKSNGSSAGTVLAFELAAGLPSRAPGGLTNVNGTLFFGAFTDDGKGVNLWKSNGTSAGTVLVKTVVDVSDRRSFSALNLNGKLLFRTDDASGVSALHVSNGSSAGTGPITKPGDRGSLSSVFDKFAPVQVGSIDYFIADDGTHGVELWKTDGTAAGTVLVREIEPGPSRQRFLNLTNVNGTLYFGTQDSLNGSGLWKSNGTSAGTVLVAAVGGISGEYLPSSLTNVNGTLFFTRRDGTNGSELWKTNGTSAGTVLVRDIRPGSSSSNLRGLTNVSGTLFFAADDGTGGTELWRSNGTSAGTLRVRDLRPGSNGSSPSDFTNVNGALFFTANDGTHGRELWKSNGSSAGTVLVRDINPGSNAYSGPTQLTNVGGTLYFAADDGTHGEELWKSNGTSAGTVQVAEIRPGTQSTYIQSLTPVGNTLYFTALSGSGTELWKTNGTSAGTTLVRDINPGSGNSSPQNLTNANGTLLFTADDGSHGRELWRSGGTAASTVMLVEALPGNADGFDDFDPFTAVGNKGYLAWANDGVHGLEPWLIAPQSPVSTFEISSPSIGQPTANGVTLNFTVTRTGDLLSTVTVAYSTADGTATAGSDYTAQTGTITFLPGQTSAVIGIAVLRDATNVGSQNFKVNLTGITNVVGPTPTFSSSHDFSAGAGPTSIAYADLNGDGKPDMVVGHYATANVSVFLNTTAPGAAAATFAAEQTFATLTNPRSVALGDMNGDGRVDLVVTNTKTNDAKVSVLLNTTAAGATTASFAAKQDFAVNFGSIPYAVTLADLNGDGRLDVATANFGSDDVSVLLNTTTAGSSTVGFAARADFVVSPAPQAIRSADINGDGKLDLVTAGYSQGGVSVLLNTTAPGATTPTFAAAQTFGAGSYLRSVAVADFNGDGKPDIAVVGSDVPTFDRYSSTLDTVAILRNTTIAGATTASFATRQLLSADLQDSPRRVTVGDMNNDGKLDLVVTNFESASAETYLNSTRPGATTFALLPVLANVVGPDATVTALADLNGDGKADMSVANNGVVSVLMNATVLPNRESTLAPKQDLQVGSLPYSVAVGDLNGDGRLDLAVANYGSNTVSVLFNTTTPGAAGPSYFTKQDFGTAQHPQSVTIGDLNGDGLPDLAVANRNGSALSILLNTTQPGSDVPSFADRQDFNTGLISFSVAAGDLNGDGILDLALVNTQSNSVGVFLNTTSPGSSTVTFAARIDFGTGYSPQSVAIGDLNGDGRTDLVTANSQANSISVLLNQTVTGSFTPSFSSPHDFDTGLDPRFVAVGDLNGDGKLDVAVASINSDAVSVFLNTTAAGTAAPSFAARKDFTTGTNPASVTMHDLNGDGRLDLVVANSQPTAGLDVVSLLLNTTLPGAMTSSFAARQDFATGSGPIFVTAGDLNGDGRPDLVTANLLSGNVSLLSNLPATIVAAAGTGTIVLNIAPVMDPTRSPALNNVVTNAGNPVGAVGTLTSQLVDFKTPAGQVDNVTDGDAGALLGIAVTRVDTTNGLWFYSINNGGTWLALTASNTAARLLAVNGQTRVYFKPNAGFTGLVAQAISFRAWDRTTGNNGDALDVSTFTGSSSFSRLGDTASIAVNTAPVLDAARTPVLTNVAKNSGDPVGAVGTLTSQLVDFKTPAGQVDNVTDADPGALLGIAVTQVDVTKGTWFYSTNNGATWTSFTASTTAARLLAVNGQTRIYFKPNANFGGTIAQALTFRAWDRSAGNNGTTADLSTFKPESSFSSTADTAAITVV